MYRLLAIAILVLAAAASSWADDLNTFQWQGNMTPGQTLTIRGISGNIAASLAPSDQAQVTAVKMGARDDPSQVQVREMDSTSGRVFCVVYPNGIDTCAPQSMSFYSNDVQVQFTIQVPAGVRLDANTVDGDIRATGLTAGITATTVNGQLAFSGIGFARATTVNGSIAAAIGSVDWTGAASFTTVNGSIDVTLPATADVVLHASTVFGSVTSDFPLPVRGPNGLSCSTGSTVHGAIGAGGRNLNLATVNGSIHLRKSQ